VAKKSKAAKKKVKPSAKSAPKKTTAKKAAAKLAKKSAVAPKAAAVGKSSSKAAKVGLAPSRNGVLVERVQESEKTAGGLYIPTTAQERPLKGKVISVGRGHYDKKGRFKPLDVKNGDLVLFTKFAGTELKLSGVDYLLLREDDILGVVNE
jgi:chaperonin GroES